jgi:glycosyltransferase involved in cell wall biosynthesis
VQPGRSGWTTTDTGPETLAAAIEGLLERPDSHRDLITAGSPRQVFEELTDPEQIRSAYLALAAEPSDRGAPNAAASGAEPPLVSIVIPYYRLDEYLEETVLSVTRQTYPRIETIVVNDGSFREADKLLDPLCERHGLRLLTQVNSGLGAARNAGIVHSRGRYVMFLDADNVITPTFIERCVEVLESDPQLAYVTTWARYIDEKGEAWRGAHGGYRPLGNWTSLVDDRNVAGDAAAVFRRGTFESGLAYSPELTSFEDWALYREMRTLGLLGAVIPERLLEYRIRERSMLREIGSPNQERIEGEIRARIKETKMRWTAPS